MIEEYRKLHTPALSDAMDELEIFSRVLAHEIRSMWRGARNLGYVQCLKLVPLELRERFDEQKLIKYMGMLNQIEKGTVAIINMDNTMLARGWGQLISKIAQNVKKNIHLHKIA